MDASARPSNRVRHVSLSLSLSPAHIGYARPVTGLHPGRPRHEHCFLIKLSLSLSLSLSCSHRASAGAAETPLNSHLVTAATKNTRKATFFKASKSLGR